MENPKTLKPNKMKRTGIVFSASVFVGFFVFAAVALGADEKERPRERALEGTPEVVSERTFVLPPGMSSSEFLEKSGEQILQRPMCGNGIVEPPDEQCDEGVQDTEGCIRCRLSHPELCGNSRLDPGEQCDDGNNIDGDDCSSSCQSERLKAKNIVVCGDGMVQLGEECDDGNRDNADACTNDCKPPRCGDGISQKGEECDDGNEANDDGCTSACKLPRLGDGVTQKGEECDDGNPVNNDGCTNAGKRPRCGDGILQSGEECDGDDSPCGGGGTCNNATCKCVRCEVVGDQCTSDADCQHLQSEPYAQGNDCYQNVHVCGDSNCPGKKTCRPGSPALVAWSDGQRVEENGNEQGCSFACVYQQKTCGTSTRSEFIEVHPTGGKYMSDLNAECDCLTGTGDDTIESNACGAKHATVMTAVRSRCRQ